MTELCSILAILWMNSSEVMYFPPSMTDIQTEELMDRAEHCYLHYELDNPPIDPIYV